MTGVDTGQIFIYIYIYIYISIYRYNCPTLELLHTRPSVRWARMHDTHFVFFWLQRHSPKLYMIRSHVNCIGDATVCAAYQLRVDTAHIKDP